MYKLGIFAAILAIALTQRSASAQTPQIDAETLAALTDLKDKIAAAAPQGGTCPSSIGQVTKLLLCIVPLIDAPQIQVEEILDCVTTNFCGDSAPYKAYADCPSTLTQLLDDLGSGLPPSLKIDSCNGDLGPIVGADLATILCDVPFSFLIKTLCMSETVLKEVLFKDGQLDVTNATADTIGCLAFGTDKIVGKELYDQVKADADKVYDCTDPQIASLVQQIAGDLDGGSAGTPTGAPTTGGGPNAPDAGAAALAPAPLALGLGLAAATYVYRL